MKKYFCIICILCSSVFGLPPIDKQNQQTVQFSQSVDNTSFISANKIFMFVTNHGSFGRDISGVFGYDAGTFFPYENYSDLENQINLKSPLYAAGLWIGGKINDSIHVSIAEYSSEFVPGPMLNGTFQSDRDEFKVYKLYYDSLEENPNDDYTNWPVGQGAPVDSLGKPLLKGHQMLWTVFNDADTNQHTNMNSPPLGIEIQQTTYAQYEPGVDTTILDARLNIFADGKVLGDVKDFDQLKTDEYMIILNYNDTAENSWTLVNKTTDETLYENQTADTSEIIDGFQLYFNFDRERVLYFETTANGNGLLDPSEPAALAFQGYKTPEDNSPTDNQQVGNGLWAVATADNGGTNGDGSRGSYAAFIERTFIGDSLRWERFWRYNWEIRFTGSYNNPGVGGGFAVNYYTDKRAYWVPFELWRINPDNPSEELRLIPWLFNDDTLFDLSSYGSLLDGTCGSNGCEHSISGGDNDPYTDWVYWNIPADSNGNIVTTYGDSAYNVFKDSAIADPTMTNWNFDEQPVMARTVLVNWNGGVQPPFTQDLPEQGTIFKISTQFDYTSDTITFIPSQSINQIMYSTENSSTYIEYKLYNKGSNYIDSCFVSIWTDPDLGGASDDMVGCDSLLDIFYCYNGDDDDFAYGNSPPAIGFKFLYGPLVPSTSDTAIFENTIISDYKNSHMYSTNLYIGGTDPDVALEAYNFMRGLTRQGEVYAYNSIPTKFMVSGDPMTGVGDVDPFSGEKRIMGTVGPFNFAPGDSQFVKIKMAVGQGSNRLNSLQLLKSILDAPEKVITDPEPWPPVNVLPTRFILSQNFPNPFNPSTTIEYDLPYTSNVKIEVFNILGQSVRTLVDTKQIANRYSIQWDGTDRAGNKLATGLYFYKITADNFTSSRKMLLLK